jgi:hypothetical protein
MYANIPSYRIYLFCWGFLCNSAILAAIAVYLTCNLISLLLLGVAALEFNMTFKFTVSQQTRRYCYIKVAGNANAACLVMASKLLNFATSSQEVLSPCGLRGLNDLEEM